MYAWIVTGRPTDGCKFLFCIFSYYTVVSDLRPFSCKKDCCFMYTILNGLSVTLVCILQEMKQCFFKKNLMEIGKGGWITITHVVHQGIQTFLWPYWKKWTQRKSRSSYNRENLVCISKESHFGENYRIITHMLRSWAFNEADNILGI